MTAALLLATATAEASALMSRVLPVVTAAALVLLVVVWLRRPRASKDVALRKKVSVGLIVDAARRVTRATVGCVSRATVNAHRQPLHRDASCSPDYI